MPIGNPEPVQFVAPHRVQQRRALHQVVPAEGKQAALGGGPQAVTRTPDPLQKDGDGTRGAQLADEVDVSYIDTQFQRRGRDQGLEFTPFQPLLGIQAVFPGQAAVMGRDELFTDAFSQAAGGPFSQAPGIDENQRGLVLFNQDSQAPVEFLPDLSSHYGFQW